MIIVGLNRIVRTVLTHLRVCDRCGQAAVHALYRTITVLTVFFIPVLPVRRRYSTRCTNCGATHRLSGSQAAELRTSTGSGQDHGHGQDHGRAPSRFTS